MMAVEGRGEERKGKHGSAAGPSKSNAQRQKGSLVASGGRRTQTPHLEGLGNSAGLSSGESRASAQEESRRERSGYRSYYLQWAKGSRRWG